MMLMQVFMDATTIYEAACSKGSASHQLMRLGFDQLIELAVSPFVLEEVRRNLAAKAPAARAAFDAFIMTAPFLIVEARPDRVIALVPPVALCDAPIVASAERTRTDWLATRDTVYLIDNDAIIDAADVQIVTPEYALNSVQEELDELSEGV